jgi:hypothetical protein
MTRDDIIRMALEAGIEFDLIDEDEGQICYITSEGLERFAALVAAPLQERIQLLYEQLNEAEKQLGQQYKMGMEAEREAIAQMVENAPPLAAFANDNGGCVTCGFTPKLAARAIRARGNDAN